MTHKIDKGRAMTKHGIDPENTEMQSAKTDGVEDHLSVDQWLRIRKEAGLRIDPETAEDEWWYAQTVDPYGVYGPSRCRVSAY